jgi:fatty-acyl-CoA synthase
MTRPHPAASGFSPAAQTVPAGYYLPEPVTLPAQLARTVARHGQREAFVAPGERLRWQALAEQVSRRAATLHAAGVRAGDHVGLLMGNGAQWLASFYACATLGAVTVPINTRFRSDELGYCLKQADIRCLIFVDRFLGIDFCALLQDIVPTLPQLQCALMLGDGPCPDWAQPLQDSPARDDTTAALAAAVSPDDILLIQYTSGTTSFPKGVMLSHRNMLQDAAAVARRIGATEEDRYFSIRPFYHVAGTTLSLLVALCSGCSLLTLPSFDVAQALDMLEQERCTLTSGNDTIFLMLMGHAEFRRERLHLRGGWAAAGPETMQRIRDEMGVPYLCNAYGLSEAAPNVVLSDWRDDFRLRAEGRALPHPGIEVRVADPALCDAASQHPQEAATATSAKPVHAIPALPADTAGEIQVRGWSVMRGYYNMPEATARATTVDGWLRTGDLGVIDQDGRLRMVGRLKDVFRVGGENVAPAEVEETLHAHPAVQQAQVIGVPDTRLGEVAAAYVVLRAGKQASVEELLAWCRQRCANFKVPRYLRLVDGFEHIGMTGSSKVQKNLLRQHALQELGLDDNNRTPA